MKYEATVSEHPSRENAFDVTVQEKREGRLRLVAYRDFFLSESRNENFDRAIEFAREELGKLTAREVKGE